MPGLVSLVAVDSALAAACCAALFLFLRELLVGESGSFAQGLRPLHGDAHVARPDALQVRIAPWRLRR